VDIATAKQEINITISSTCSNQSVFSFNNTTISMNMTGLLGWHHNKETPDRGRNKFNNKPIGIMW
jgi:hypothetical protein